ncbi:MAG: radical SAM protein [Alphaproteobacteria bacterium]|nr:radical SAM protein [Alphaproteobacteria bacterium]
MTRTPTIEWQVAGACNYDCSYCIQSRRYRRGAPAAERIPRAIDFFASLPGTWEIKMSGGEAFAHALFLDAIAPGIVERTPHRVSVLTNFSASHRDLMRFAGLTRGRLEVFSASLHLEFTTLEAFAEKAAWFVDQLDPGVRFVVNQVVRPGRIDEARACRDHLAARGIRWFPQLYKVNGGIAEYADAAGLAELLGDAPGPREANTAPSYEGRLCWAGTQYFTVDKDGTVWSCRTAKRHGEGRLGNLYDGDVRLHDGPAPCPYRICPCTVPANRGMIEGIA